MSKTHSPRTCATCSIVYTPTGPSQKYCTLDCKPKSYNHVCKHCDAVFASKQKKQSYCSTRCYADSGAAGKAGSKGGSLYRIHPGGRGFHPNAPDIIKNTKAGTPNSWSVDNGYILYYWDHPAVKTQRIHEHRAVAFALGLDIKGMHVDHIDGDKGNNEPSNLQVLTPSEHGIKTSMHDGPTGFWVWVKENRPEWIEEWRANKNDHAIS